MPIAKAIGLYVVARVTRCPGLPGTVPEWNKMSRVPARSITKYIVAFAIVLFYKSESKKYICNINKYACIKLSTDLIIAELLIHSRLTVRPTSNCKKFRKLVNAKRVVTWCRN